MNKLTFDPDQAELSKGNGPKSADQKFCHACSKVLYVTAQACPSCGAPQPSMEIIMTGQQRPTLQQLPANHVFCSGCGKSIHKTATSCPSCGAVHHGRGVGKGRKDRTTAGLFALLLGSFGAHHFYLGNVGLGILYLIFFWTWIPFIIGIIEGIVFLTQSDEEFSRKYNN